MVGERGREGITLIELDFMHLSMVFPSEGGGGCGESGIPTRFGLKLTPLGWDCVAPRLGMLSTFGS